MKHWKPWFIENSKIPVWLSYVAPIDINAITLGPVVISRDEMSEQTKRHETIHFQQYLELLFVGFVVLYVGFWLWNIIGGAKFTFSSLPEALTLDSFFVLVTFTTKSSGREFSPIT